MAIIFYSKSPQYAWLSNFSPHKFKLERWRWSSVEHYYQAQKFLDPDTFEQIRNAVTPLKARKIAQNRSLVPRSDWLEIREEVMYKAVCAKFQQNRKLTQSLLATTPEILIHRSSKDLFWGQNEAGIGNNRLGEILMEVRRQLSSTSSKN